MLAGFSEEALQRAYDAGLITYESMYDKVQLQLQMKGFNVAACEAVVHESGATNFDVSVPVPYSTFSRLPHVAPEFLPAIIQGAPVAYPLSLSTADTRETSRARQSKEDGNNAASAQVNDAASYANVRSDVMQAAYEAGCMGAKVHRFQQTRGALRRWNPDKDFSQFTTSVVFPNMSPADIEALDEDAFMAKINKWKRANGLETDAVEAQRKHNAQTVETNRADREAYGGTIRFKLAPECTTEISKPRKAEELRAHLTGFAYDKKRRGKKLGEPCKTCVAFVGKLYNGTACVPCDQFYVPRVIDIIKAARDAQNDYNIKFGVEIDPEDFRKKSKKRKKSASKPQGAKKAKKAAPAK